MSSYTVVPNGDGFQIKIITYRAKKMFWLLNSGIKIECLRDVDYNGKELPKGRERDICRMFMFQETAIKQIQKWNGLVK